MFQGMKPFSTLNAYKKGPYLPWHLSRNTYFNNTRHRGTEVTYVTWGMLHHSSRQGDNGKLRLLQKLNEPKLILTHNVNLRSVSSDNQKQKGNTSRLKLFGGALFTGVVVGSGKNF